MRVEMEEILVAKLAMILKTASTPTPPLSRLLTRSLRARETHGLERQTRGPHRR